jgi:hypothetical protein
MDPFTGNRCPPGVTLFGPTKFTGNCSSFSEEAIKKSEIIGIEPHNSENMDVVGEKGKLTPNDFDSEDGEEFDEDGEEFDEDDEDDDMDIDKFFKMLSNIFGFVESFDKKDDEEDDEEDTFDNQISEYIYKKLYGFLFNGPDSLGSCMDYAPEWNDFSVEEAVHILKDMNDDFYENLHQNQILKVYDFVSTLHEYLVESERIQDIEDEDDEEDEFSEDGEEGNIIYDDMFGPDSGNYFDAQLDNFGGDTNDFFDMLSKIHDNLTHNEQISSYEIYKKLYGFLFHSVDSLGSRMDYAPEWNDFSVCEAVRILKNMDDDFYENLHPNQMMKVYDFVSTLHEYLLESGQIEDKDF